MFCLTCLLSVSFAAARISMVCFAIFLAIFASGHNLHRGQTGYHIVEIFMFVFLTTGLIGVILTFPLRCLRCGKSLCVVMNKSEISPKLLDREKSGSLAERIKTFFIPSELTLGTTHCVHCDEEYLLFGKE
jgi:hypothetical protein